MSRLTNNHDRVLSCSSTNLSTHNIPNFIVLIILLLSILGCLDSKSYEKWIYFEIWELNLIFFILVIVCNTLEEFAIELQLNLV